MWRSRNVLLIAIVIAAFSWPAVYAQTPSKEAAAAQVRRDELARVLELVADPDPLQRVANMEAIIATHDAMKIQIAIKSAFASDDAQMRQMAMRAYMASISKLIFDIKLPDQDQKQWESFENDRSQEDGFIRNHGYINGARKLNFQLILTVKNFSITANRGSYDIVGASGGDFTIAGDRFTTSLSFSYFDTCNLEFRPTRNVTLSGTLTCQSAPRLAIIAQPF